MTRTLPDHGAFVCSLDFELMWGVRDRLPPDGGDYRRNLLGERQAIPRMLDLFEEFDVAATWATVGFLFASTRGELERFYPAIRPEYRHRQFSPYLDSVGRDEEEDPLHFASAVIDEIHRRPRQEIGSHTFSHYYCLEEGQTEAAFRADLESARRIAAKHGIALSSLVLPRNQYNPRYAQAILDAGIRTYRGNERSWMYRADDNAGATRQTRRAGRLLDSYLPIQGSHVTPWSALTERTGLTNVASSRFLRPYSPRLRHLEPLRLRRITQEIERAARTRGVFHLWWHPHNFGTHLEENARFLRKVLSAYRTNQQRFGMRSLGMAEVHRILDG